MENSERGRRIQIRHPAQEEPQTVVAQVYDEDGRAVGAEVPVENWAAVRGLERAHAIPPGHRQVTTEARLILGEESGDIPL